MQSSGAPQRSALGARTTPAACEVRRRSEGVCNLAWLPGPPALSHCDVCLKWPCATRRAADPEPGPGPGAYDAPVTAASSKHSRGPAPAFGSGRTGSLSECAAATMCAAVGLQCSAGRDVAAFEAYKPPWPPRASPSPAARGRPEHAGPRAVLSYPHRPMPPCARLPRRGAGAAAQRRARPGGVLAAARRHAPAPRLPRLHPGRQAGGARCG